MTSASTRSSTSSNSARLSGPALVFDIAGSPSLALVRGVAGSPSLALVLDVAGSPALALVLGVAGSPSLALVFDNADGTFTDLTAANTAAFTRIDGFDNNRPLLAVLAFEGVLSVSSEGRMYFRVQAHLLRYVLLDVDGTMPRILSTPARDPFNNNPIDDFDD